MKTIVFFNIPAHGHTNPTLAVVKQLCGMGHKVYYFSFRPFREQIRRAGAEFISCDDFSAGVDVSDNSGERLSKDVAYATKVIVETTLALDDMICKRLEEIMPDVVVYDSMAFWGKLAAKKMGIPSVSSTTTFAFNKYSAPDMEGGPAGLIKLVFQLALSQKHIKKLRAKGYRVKNIFDIIANNTETDTIVYTSPMFQPFSETFGHRYSFVGPLIKDSYGVTRKGVRPVVYISLGTVVNDRPEFFSNCIKAFGGSEFDVIISMGNKTAACNEAVGEENIKILPYADQVSILKTADVFITHCGMNSTNEGLYFGVPLVMYPQTAEQKTVAQRVKQLGAGIMPGIFSPEEILNSCLLLVNDTSYKAKAEIIGQSFKQCGGAGLAAEKILEVCE